MNNRAEALAKLTPETLIGDTPMDDGEEGASDSNVIVLLELSAALNDEREVNNVPCPKQLFWLRSVAKQANGNRSHDAIWRLKQGK